ncbi:MAG: site-specific DNA-methyltransferase [Actinomycetota bacterium]|nr:site-specific DNA-methyltransferase [Actinomycetota bacterium]
MSQPAWAHAHETIIWASKGRGARHTFNYDLMNSPNSGAQVSSVWRIRTVPKGEKAHGYHPTQKPLRLLRRALLASTDEGDLVFDPFSGSGTTAVAAKELGRFLWGRSWTRGTWGSPRGGWRRRSGGAAARDLGTVLDGRLSEKF